MAKLRNVSDDTLLLGPVGVEVAPDEVVEVPDDVFNQHSWAESLWAVVSSPKKSTSKSGTTASEE